jgi:hypothetical protein
LCGLYPEMSARDFSSIGLIMLKLTAFCILGYMCSKRRKGEKSGGKGLRHFSMKVCEKVQKKGITTYNEVADELVSELSDLQSGFSDIVSFMLHTTGFFSKFWVELSDKYFCMKLEWIKNWCMVLVQNICC